MTLAYLWERGDIIASEMLQVHCYQAYQWLWLFAMEAAARRNLPTLGRWTGKISHPRQRQLMLAFCLITLEKASFEAVSQCCLHGEHQCSNVVHRLTPVITWY